MESVGISRALGFHGRVEAATGWLPHLVRRIDLILAGKVGRIEPANCLEQFVFFTHISRFHPGDYPAEFSAFMLESKTNKDQWQIFFSFGDGRKFDVSPPDDQSVYQKMIREVMNGWSLEYFLHSHPFMFNYKIPHVGGTVLPSDEDIRGDIALIKDLGLKKVWITNGMDSIRIPASQLKLLKSTLPASPTP